MNVKFYKTDKKHNSTLIPTTALVEYMGVLKDDCSFVAPVIGFQFAQNFYPDYNYAYISDFRRYYFISDWVYADRLWYAHMVCDVLATNRTEIGDSYQYIARSSRAYNGRLCDNTYPTKADISASLTDPDEPLGWVINPNNGYWVVGIIANNHDTTGAVDYYIFDKTGIESFNDALLGNPSWLGFTGEDISTAMVKGLINPYQYVASCMWYPFMPPSADDGWTTSSIKFGWWDISGIRHRRLSFNTPWKIHSLVFTVPNHPQHSRGLYLNTSPYTLHTLAMPCFGETSIEGLDILNDTTYRKLRISITTDCISGEGRMVAGVNSLTCAVKRAQVGVPMQLAQVALDSHALINTATSTMKDVGGHVANFMQNASWGMMLGGAVGSAIPIAGTAVGMAVGALASIHAGGDLVNAGISLACGITEAASHGWGQVETSGGTGSFAEIFSFPRLISKFTKVVDEDLMHRGRPLSETRQIKDLGATSENSGYIKCVNAHMHTVNGTTFENKSIEDFLNEGFYYE